MTAGLTFRTWTCWQTRGVSVRLMKWSLTSRWTIEPLCLRVCSHASLPLAQNTPLVEVCLLCWSQTSFTHFLWIGKTGLRSLLTGNFFPVLQTHTLSDLTLRSLSLSLSLSLKTLHALLLCLCLLFLSEKTKKIPLICIAGFSISSALCSWCNDSASQTFSSLFRWPQASENKSLTFELSTPLPCRPKLASVSDRVLPASSLCSCPYGSVPYARADGRGPGVSTVAL